jgi:hypothetical protein
VWAFDKERGRSRERPKSREETPKVGCNGQDQPAGCKADMELFGVLCNGRAACTPVFRVYVAASQLSFSTKRANEPTHGVRQRAMERPASSESRAGADPGKVT